MKIKNTTIQVVQSDTSGLKVDLIVPPLTIKSPNEKNIREYCRRFLEEAGAKAAGSIAFAVPPVPSVPDGTNDGEGRIPASGFARIITQELLRHLRFGKTSLKEVVLCIADTAAFETFEKTVRGYIDHIQDTLGKGPYATVDAIIELKEGIILVERSNPPYGWALPGGFVDYGESLEEAVMREAKEETNMDLEDLRQFHVYSEPERDPRFHTISTVFTARGKGSARSGDDAKGLKIVPHGNLLKLDYAFDHKQIIADYLKQRGRKRG